MKKIRAREMVTYFTVLFVTGKNCAIGEGAKFSTRNLGSMLL